MPKFEIALTAEAFVSASVTIEAKNEEEAKEKALKMAKEGNVEWIYDGFQEGTEDIGI